MNDENESTGFADFIVDTGIWLAWALIWFGLGYATGGFQL